MKDPRPSLKLTRTRGKQRDVFSDSGGGVQPRLCSTSHSLVQARAALLSENCPELPSATSNGAFGWIWPCSISRSGRYPASVAVGVGQDEEAATPVASAHFSRREQARFCVVTQIAKLAGDFGKSQIEVAFDVLEKHRPGPDFADDPCDLGPQVARIGLAPALAGQAERLARISGREDMNAAAPWLAVKGSEIVPDRCLIQRLVCHPRHESGRSVHFPLDVTDSAISGLGNAEAEVEPAISGAEREAANVA